MDLGEHILYARPNAYISSETANELGELAKAQNLDFVGVVSGHVEVLDHVDYDSVLSLRDEPVMSIMVRNICIGIYRKDFMKEHGIRLCTNENTIFPDLVMLWQTFVHCGRAMFKPADLCERVESDTVWINDTDAAFSVNRQYDHIKDTLMEDWELWEKWKYYYSLQRYRCYFEMLHWMNEDTGWAFAERMVVDFHRSMELGEVDEIRFSPEERTVLAVLRFDPGFVKRFYLGKPILGKQIYDLRAEAGTFEDRMRQMQEKSDVLADELRRQVNEQKAIVEKLQAELEQTREEAKAELDKTREAAKAELEQTRIDAETALENQKNEYESSAEYRAGKVIMAVPNRLRRTDKSR